MKKLGRRRFTAHLLGGAGALISARAARGVLAGDAPGEWAPTRRYRACIIGHTGRGNYGHGLDTCFQSIPAVSVAAVADPVEAGRLAAARRSGAERSYADWREMLAREKPELVSIGPRWVEARLEMIRAAAEIGAHVYMEKPMASSLEEADAIVAVAAQAKIHIALAFHSLASPQVLHLKKLVADGLLGDLLEMRTRGKEDRRAGGEDLMVLGTHCVYLLRLFGGDPLWCTARVTQDSRDITRSDAREASEPLGLVAGDTIHASYAFPGGVQGHFASQKLARGPGGRFQCVLHGSRGCALIPIGMEPEVHYLPDPLWSPGESRVPWQPLPGAPPAFDASGLKGQEGANRRLVLELLAAIETGRKPRASGEEGRAVLEMIHAVYSAHLSAARVAIPLRERKHPLAAVS